VNPAKIVTAGNFRLFRSKLSLDDDDDDDDGRLRIPTTQLLRVVTNRNNTRLWQFPQICFCSDGEVDKVQEVEETAHFEAGVGGSPL
jgi:hypothetical protein